MKFLIPKTRGGGAKLAYIRPEWGFNVAKWGLYPDSPLLFQWSDIYPVVPIQFEDYTVYSPNNADKYLTRLYGNYLSFPRRKLQHHTIYDEKGGPIRVCDLASINDVDMDEVFTKLKDIEKFFRAM